jgi:hypothetical protein
VTELRCRRVAQPQDFLVAARAIPDRRAPLLRADLPCRVQALQPEPVDRGLVNRGRFTLIGLYLGRST